MTRIVRDLEDAALRLDLVLPDGWLQFTSPAALFVFGGPVSAAPVVAAVAQLDAVARPADAPRSSAEDAALALRDAVLVHAAPLSPDGLDTVAEVRHRTETGEQTQHVVLRHVHRPAEQVLVTVMTACPVDASPEALDGCRAVVASLTVQDLPGTGAVS